MNTLPADEIPVLTDIVEPNAGSESAFINDTSHFLRELESHLTAVVHEHADELVHNALREMEALLLEQVSDRLKAELPRIVSRVIAEHFRGPGLAN
jgi:flagellar biosynthesis/type III secretory pathway protein FliH